MRREVLYQSIDRIVTDLIESSVPDYLDHLLDGFRNGTDTESGAKLSLDVFHKYTIATHLYGEAERRIIEILGISQLIDVQYWETLLRAPENPKFVFEMSSKVRFVVEHTPRLLALIEQDYVQAIKGDHEGLPEELKGKSLLSVLVVEENEQFSSPARLTRALESISNLYYVFACLEGESANDLIVLACDSGSDKSFDFLGLAKLTEQVKETIIAIWDRRVFYRQKHVSESLALIAESLPIIEKISDLKESGKLEPEQAELLKRKAIAGATQFIEAGATIPELDGVSRHSPKQLLKPEPKLLVSPWIDSPNGEQDDERTPRDIRKTEKGDLSEEEAEMLSSLLKRAKKNKKKKKKKKLKPR